MQGQDLLFYIYSTVTSKCLSKTIFLLEMGTYKSTLLSSIELPNLRRSWSAPVVSLSRAQFTTTMKFAVMNSWTGTTPLDQGLWYLKIYYYQMTIFIDLTDWFAWGNFDKIRILLLALGHSRENLEHFLGHKVDQMTQGHTVQILSRTNCHFRWYDPK